MSSNIDRHHHEDQDHPQDFSDSQNVIDPFLYERRSVGAEQGMTLSNEPTSNRSFHRCPSFDVQQHPQHQQQETLNHTHHLHHSFQMPDFPDEQDSHLSPLYSVDEFLDEIVDDSTQTWNADPGVLNHGLSSWAVDQYDGNQLNAGDGLDSSHDTPVSRNLIDLSDNDVDVDGSGGSQKKNQDISASHSPRSLTAVANPNEHLIDSYGSELVPEVVVRECDQTALSDKLSGDSLFDSSNHEDCAEGNRQMGRRIVSSFRQPLQSRATRPRALSNDARCLTPQSSPIRPTLSHQASSGPVSPSRSRISIRSGVSTPRSETHFHTYETNPEAPSSQVPPFVVVHRTGHAVVKITPKGTTFAISGPRTLYEEDGSISSALPCRVWCRPVIIMIMAGIAILGAVTVITGVIKKHVDKNGSESITLPGTNSSSDVDLGGPLTQPPSIAPMGDVGMSFPSNEPASTPNEANNTSPTDGVVKVPYEDTPSPAFVPPSRAPRPPQPVATVAPSSSPSFNPSSHPSEIPWSSYVIGLISTRSPHSFSELDDPSSPQYQGLKWISLDLSGGATYNSDQSLQRWAMATFFYATRGEFWSDNTDWLTSSHECNWYGVSCDDSFHLTGLDLDSNKLDGTLPVEVDLLVDLQVLALSQNNISGTLSPTYSQLDQLEEFVLSNNRLRGSLPWEYSNWDLLQTLDLSQNELTGSIPSEFGDMGSLVSLNLCTNKLTGTVPTQLGDLINLISLQLGNNQLIGKVPEQVCDVVNDSIQNTRNVTAQVVVDCIVDCSCCNSGCCEAANGGSDGDYAVTQPVCCSA